MNFISVRGRVALLLGISIAGLWLGGCGQKSTELAPSLVPLQRNSNLEMTAPVMEPIAEQVTADVSNPVVEDGWRDQSAKAAPEEPEKIIPDRSYRTVWVNIFPVYEMKKASLEYVKRMPAPDPYGATRDLSSLRLQRQGSTFKIARLSDGSIIAEGQSLTFQLSNGTMAVDGQTYPLEGIYVSGDSDSATDVFWDHHTIPFTYRGGFVITQENGLNGSSCLRAVNVVDFDDYLKGVVPSEMPAEYPLEALKVQAVAARTYALNKMLFQRCNADPKTGQCRRTQPQGFDIFPNTEDQLYLGIAKEQPQSNRAVTETSGLVVTYRGHVIQAMFHGNSGGRTCSYFDCYGSIRVPYLQSVEEPDPEEIRAAPGGRSFRSIDGRALAKALRARGVPFADDEVVDFEPSVRNASERAVEAVVEGPNEFAVVPENVLRELRGQFDIATMFLGTSRADSAGGSIRITSYGWGHGVGLSQEGARLQAQHGADFKHILEFYYKGTRVVDLRKL